MFSTSLAVCVARGTCVAFVTAGSALAGNVITVDAAGGADFTNLQFAINAAADGDTILVKTGTYPGFTIDGKGVRVVEDSGQDVVIASTVVVRNVAAARRVVLSGLRILPPETTSATLGVGVDALNNAGAIRFYACEIAGADGPDVLDSCSTFGWPGKLAFRLHSSPNVALASSFVHGGRGGDHDCPLFQNPGLGGQGVNSTSSTIAAYACVIEGGDAGHGGDRPSRGGVGIGLHTSGLFVSETPVQGGDGSSTSDFECWVPGEGGAGASLDAASVLQRLASPIAGGAGGTNSCGDHGDDGNAILGGSVFTFNVSPLRFVAPGVAREGTSVSITFTGDPGDRIVLLESDDTAFQSIPSWRGFLLVDTPDSPARVRKLGVIPASGTLTRSYHVPALASGVESSVRYLQAYRIAGTGITLGSFVPLVVVDSSF